MKEEKFEADWDVHQRIEKLAIDAFRRGLSPEEVQELVLQSNEYMEWKSIERCFGTEYHQLFYYRDLAGAVEFEKYEDRIKHISRLVANGEKIEEDSSFLEEYQYDRLFHQIGIKITPVELGKEIGKLSELLNLTEPLGILQFLGLITNNPSSLLYLGLDEVSVLKNKENEIQLYLEGFTKTYTPIK
ncbi:hypothetical protein [Paenibacillus aceris]|uniref:Uncharacterized protein n=1 Tax=Paenibacillus aceris TaxID=869555 RepID=A0ABS4I793_9BACL|nr:hypothetical protein [Paenibacillus aceris]MBP1966276.1 hypothetical protein [Paenibacillus aceris]NHW38537.1 hypothetical protein [Paenibacillus aceris]